MKKEKTILKYEEICLYCKSYNADKRQCRGKDCAPNEKPADKNCRYFHKSDDAKFAFADGGIGYLAETDWSRFKREGLLKRFEKILKGK